MDALDIEQRVAGLLLGGALGDSIGNGTRERPYGWLTDDTQLTCATCEALRANGVEPESIAAEYLAWHRGNRLAGLGAATLEALQGLAAGGHWALVGRNGEYAAGNGAAMRMAPLGFVLDVYAGADRRLIRDVARITHRNEEAYAGALAVIAGVQLGFQDFGAVADTLPDSVTRDRLTELDAAPFDSVPAAAKLLGTSGWAADTVPLAFACASLAARKGLLHVLREVAALDGDRDTIGSMTGQLFGAAHGPASFAEAVPDVPGSSEVHHVAREFSAWLNTDKLS